MARPLRVEFAGACYHVINRGNNRRNLFSHSGAGEAFMRVLKEAAIRYHWRIHAYVVMSNHFHLAVELTEPNLSEGMRWLQGTWARRHHRHRKPVGKPFQGRYKALLVERGRTLGQVCHYIHLNPIRARTVTARTIANYALSSLKKFRPKGRPSWLEPTVVLGSAGKLPDTEQGWNKYLEYLEFLATDEVAKKQLVAARLSRGWCIGPKKFRDEMTREARTRGAALSRGRGEGLAAGELSEEKERSWEEKLQRLAALAKIDFGKLGPRKSAPAKVLLAAAMKQGSSATNAWLADRLQMGQPASVSQFSRRLMLQTEGKRSVERLLSKVKH